MLAGTLALRRGDLVSTRAFLARFAELMRLEEEDRLCGDGGNLFDGVVEGEEGVCMRLAGMIGLEGIIVGMT